MPYLMQNEVMLETRMQRISPMRQRDVRPSFTSLPGVIRPASSLRAPLAARTIIVPITVWTVGHNLRSRISLEATMMHEGR